MRTDYRSLREGLRKRLLVVTGHEVPITKTLLWWYETDIYRDNPRKESTEEHFYKTPPVRSASTSDRVLFVGTKQDCRELYTQREKAKKRGGILLLPEDITGEAIYERLRTKRRLPPEERLDYSSLCSINLVFCAETGNFWQAFFGKRDFLDGKVNERSVPEKIITTGRIRTYTHINGMTIPCGPRLVEIAEKWGIPIEFARDLQPLVKFRFYKELYFPESEWNL